MAFNIEHFEIAGVHGRTIRANFEKNRLILVGENGTGKSTVLSIMYCFLTAQWQRLAKLPFTKLSTSLNGIQFELHRAQLEVYLTQITEQRHSKYRISPLAEKRLQRFAIGVIGRPTAGQIIQIAERAELPVSLVRHYFLAGPDRGQETIQGDIIAAAEKILEDGAPKKILYLPTYRSIEHDLKYVFPKLYERLINETGILREEIGGEQGRRFREMVKFGMRDVEELWKTTGVGLRERARIALSALIGNYLKDVISGAYKDYAYELSDVSQKVVEDVVAHISDEFISASEKNRIIKSISSATHAGNVSEDEKVIAHLFSKIYALYKDQKEKEYTVRKFAEMCNGYLVGKKIVYDDLQYEIKIIQDSGPQEGQSLSLSALSSGEKQVVSLFCEVYLTQPDSFLVIIDEPELSLSVPWQRKLLPDIVSNNLCEGLIAVTHSPFIFDNELKSVAHDIDEFWR